MFYFLLGPPTPSSKSALAQLLASVQNTGETRPAGENALRQIKQGIHNQQPSQKRKRSTQRPESQPTLQSSQGLTPIQQKKIRLLMQQPQPQQGSLTTGQIILGQQSLTGQGRYAAHVFPVLQNFIEIRRSGRNPSTLV